MRTFIKGLLVGLILQLAIGPVFFFIANLTLHRTIFDGLAGVLAVTLVDYFYISLSLFGVSKLLKNDKTKKIFGIISSIVLMLFGLVLIFGAKAASGSFMNQDIGSSNIIASFLSVLLLTISSPLTIVFFTGVFTAKSIEYNLKKKELFVFGFGAGFATLVFMTLSVILLSLIKGFLSVLLVQALNILVGSILILYGLFRIAKIFSVRKT